MKTKKFFIDLFAGCGGLSLGLEKSGFHPIFVNEINKVFIDFQKHLYDKKIA